MTILLSTILKHIYNQVGGSETKEECNTLMYRAMVAQGKYSMVKSEISSDASSDLQAVKRLVSCCASACMHPRTGASARIRAHLSDHRMSADVVASLSASR